MKMETFYDHGGTYLMLGNRSDTIPLNSFRSSTKNLGTFTSRIALRTISSYLG